MKLERILLQLVRTRNLFSNLEIRLFEICKFLNVWETEISNHSARSCTTKSRLVPLKNLLLYPCLYSSKCLVLVFPEVAYSGRAKHFLFILFKICLQWPVFCDAKLWKFRWFYWLVLDRKKTSDNIDPALFHFYILVILILCIVES